MASESLGNVLHRLGRAVGLQGDLTLSDAQLLDRFVSRRDEPAFAALMARHGPMVLGVCRRLLRDAGEAEDAFQAAFLVLARKASAIQRRALLGAWLYGVAFRVASRLRGRAERRRIHERPGLDPEALISADDASWSDVRPVVHEEVQRLPEKYRNPVVLCYLEGKTHEEAAAQLRAPLGTVKSQLTRAREMLRTRLARRGLALSPPLVATALVVHKASAAGPLLESTLGAAIQFAAGDASAGGLASAKAVALTQGALRTMAMTKVIFVAALALALTVFAGIGGFAYRTLAAEPGADPAAARPNANPAAPAGKPADKPKDDKEAIQGVWRISSIELEGKEAPDNDIWKGTRAARYVISADTVTIQLKGRPDLVARYKLDPSKNPKEIDYLPDDEMGETNRGVYSLDGDVLKICTPVRPETARPAELKTREIKPDERGRTALLTYQRETGGKDKEALQGVWRVDSVEVGGKAATGRWEEEVGAEWIVTDKAVEYKPKSPDRVGHSTWFRINADKTPKEIDLIPIIVGAIRPGEDDPTRGIYTLEGDAWKVALAGVSDLADPPAAAKERPKELATKEGGYTVLFTLKRVK